jgi:hypothetical protein
MDFCLYNGFLAKKYMDVGSWVCPYLPYDLHGLYMDFI